MSIQFNDTTAYKGLVQFYEKECGFDRGDISGDTDKLKEFAADANVAFDDFWAIAMQSSNTWKNDDKNHSGDPEILINVIDGTRKYSIFQDASSNQTIEVFKVFYRQSTSDPYYELYPHDPKTQDGVNSFEDGLNQDGQPTYYKKEGMSIELDLTPPSNVTSGIKVLISREASYFVYTDTTKMPGVPGILHKYFYINPAETYARIHGLENHTKLRDERERLEKVIRATFGQRSKDEKTIIRGRAQQHE